MTARIQDFPQDNIRKILVTGGTGFIGSHLIPELVKREFEVFSCQRHVTGRCVLGDLPEVMNMLCDLRDAFAVRKLIRKLVPDAVVHLAATSPVSYSYDHPQEVIESNLLGTVNLAEACLREVPGIKHFLFASTSETYGNGPNPKKEEMLLNPNSPYAVSKVACEKYLMYLYDAHQFPVTILRNFNTYGRKRNIRFVVERAISQMIKGSEIRLGNPDPMRDFIYVDDHAYSYLACLGRDEALGEIFNFCTGRGVSIKELVELISELIGFRGRILWHTIPKRPLDIQVMIGGYSKAKKKLGWVPKYTLEEGLDLTIQYFKQNIR